MLLYYYIQNLALGSLPRPGGNIMGFGHIYVKANDSEVLREMDQFLGSGNFVKIDMTPATHPKKMKEIHETDLRLFWVSPQLNSWSGIFEFRYYNNEFRERWGYTDEALSMEISKNLSCPVYRMEVIDTSGFWMYHFYENGKEVDTKVYQDDITQRSTDLSHPRYALNQIIQREGIENISLGYENIAGEEVSAIENCRYWKDGIKGEGAFTHRAYRAKALVSAETTRP